MTDVLSLPTSYLIHQGYNIFEYVNIKISATVPQ